MIVTDELRLENLSERYLFDTRHRTGEASTYDDGRFMSTQFCYSTIVKITKETPRMNFGILLLQGKLLTVAL